VIGVAALLTAIASLFGVAGTFFLAIRSQKKVQEVHVLVNSRLTAETNRVTLLEEILVNHDIEFPERTE